MAGMLWSKQFYHYVVWDWLKGDPEPKPPRSRREGRNHDWGHLFNRDVISMPDNWEYPWYAAWDLAFHMITLRRIDPVFRQGAILLLLREWYMHPNGQLPAYEFAFDDVNPPVHAWACWRVYKMTGRPGKRDCDFLNASSKNCCSISPGGSTAKTLRASTSSAAGFSAWTTSESSIAPSHCPMAGSRSRPTARRGWRFIAGRCCRCALELSRYDPAYEDSPSNSSSTSPPSSTRSTRSAERDYGTRKTAFITTSFTSTAKPRRCTCDRWSVSCPSFPAKFFEEVLIDSLPGFNKRMQWFLKHQGYLAKHITAKKKAGHNGQDAYRCCWRFPRRIGWSGC